MPKKRKTKEVNTSPRQVAEYITARSCGQESKCPFCGAGDDHLVGDSFDFVDDCVYHEMSCDKCDEHWGDCYRLIGIMPSDTGDFVRPGRDPFLEKGIEIVARMIKGRELANDKEAMAALQTVLSALSPKRD